MNHYIPSSVAKGMSPRCLAHLSERDKRRVIKLLARVSEKSYRRGFQHGTLADGRRTIDPEEFRFRRSIDQSPPALGGAGSTAEERLFMEYAVLEELGLHEKCREGLS